MNDKLKWIATFVASVMLSGAALELFLKYAGVSAPVLSYFHEDLGTFPRPNLKYIKFKEGFFLGESNSHSRFGENFLKQKPADAFRIGLVGDSYVEGLDVLSRHHFRKILEDDLHSRTGRRIEVLNFGRGNSTLPFTAYMLMNYALDYELDLVLFFVEGRDRDPQPWSGRTGYELRDGELVVNADWRQSSKYGLFKWLSGKPVLNRIFDLSTLGLVNRVVNNIQHRSFSWILLDKFHPFIFSDANRRADGRKIPSEQRKHVSVVEASERIVRKLVARGKQGAPEILFVIRPLPSGPAPELEPFLVAMDADYLDLGEIFVGGVGDILLESGIDAKYFKASGASGGHWNHAGHRAVGRYLASRVSDRLSEKGKSQPPRH